MADTTNAPAGWYPQGDGQQRYWNGESWTQHFAPSLSTQPASRPSSKPARLAGPGSRPFGKAAAFGWGGLALTAVIGALSSGFSGAAILAGLFTFVLGVIALARGRIGWARLRSRGAAGVVIGAALALLTIGAVAAPPPAPSSPGLPLTSRAAAPARNAAAETTTADSAAAEVAAAAAAAAADKAAADAAAKATADAAAATAKAASDAAAKTARDAAAKQAKAVAAASAKAQAAAQAKAAAQSRAQEAAAASAKAKAAAQAKASASAPPPPAATSYANCTAMHAVYKGGVALPGAVDHRSNGGHAKYAPVYNRALYEANSFSDRDGDGIACEA
ncbi:hypothetical protein BJ986_001965 [Phycicoccus badiiscoriae]|uniref:Excalibur calcium-binding domain-containing protein n=1 Tax=Pedococcus badiiscoriae TaxID=642776 RepID=A0A852WEN1_9MICO|nr:DUF2510 domain-containing protein [Pedococcus badiiscoriae]NYG07478.1 hypothetical protein [Pedococcus badiiscoriae]